MQQVFSEYLVYMKVNKNYAKSTIAYNTSVLREFVKKTDKDIENLEPWDIDRFLLFKSETCKKSTLNLTKGVLRAFFEYCQVYRGMRMRFSYQIIRRKKDPPSEVSYLTKEQVEMAILQMRHPQDRLITKTFFETGMRIGEIVSLRVEDIGLWEITIKGKGGYTRVVPINDGLHTALRNHLYLNNLTKGPVFRQLQKQRNNQRETYAEDTIRKRLQREFAKVGIKMHPHMLRHGFGTHLLINDVDLRSIQSLMGHKSLETTQIYTHLTGKHLKKAVACFV